MTLLRTLFITFKCMYVCNTYVCIYRERESGKQIDCLWKQIVSFPVPKKHIIVVYPAAYRKCPSTTLLRALVITFICMYVCMHAVELIAPHCLPYIKKGARGRKQLIEYIHASITTYKPA